MPKDYSTGYGNYAAQAVLQGIIAGLSGHGIGKVFKSLRAPSTNHPGTPFRKPTRKRSFRKMPYTRRSTRPKLRRRSGRVYTKQKKRKRRGLSKAAAAEVKRIIAKKMKVLRSSSRQQYTNVETALMDGSLYVNRKLQRFVPFINTVSTEHGLINIIDSTLPTINGVAVTYRDLTSSTVNNSIINTLGGSYMKLELANNYAYDLVLDFYHCYCKDNGDDTSTPLKDYQEVLDKHVTVGTTLATLAEEDPVNSLSQYRTKLAHWVVGKKTRVVIKAGDMKVIMHYPKRASFSVAKYRDYGMEIQKGFSSGVFLDVRGAVAHGRTEDTQGSNIGYADFRLDCITTRLWNYNIYRSDYLERKEQKIDLDTMTNPEVMQEALALVTDVNEDPVP